MFAVSHRARLCRTVDDGRDRPRFLRKPGEGHESGRCLGNTVNALIFYWVQGYMSAANIALLEGRQRVRRPLPDGRKEAAPADPGFLQKEPRQETDQRHRSTHR